VATNNGGAGMKIDYYERGVRLTAETEDEATLLLPIAGALAGAPACLSDVVPADIETNPASRIINGILELGSVE
jgi:hypothetical protein